MNCLRHAAIWYEDHRHRCPYEPRLAELEPAVGLYTTAVWQCERGHRYFQDLHSPLRPPSDSDGDSGDDDGEGGGPQGWFGEVGCIFWGEWPEGARAQGTSLGFGGFLWMGGPSCGAQGFGCFLGAWRGRLSGTPSP